VVQLWNLWADNGGFLETNRSTPAVGGKYDVCTNAYWNRGGDVADWRFVKPHPELRYDSVGRWEPASYHRPTLHQFNIRTCCDQHVHERAVMAPLCVKR
jgi:hypothetical protein